LIKGIDQYQRRDGQFFRGWLATVFHHVYIDNIRDRASELELERVGSWLHSRDACYEWEQDEYNRWLVSRALKMIRSDFSDQTWKIFEALMLQHRSVAEVARQFNVSSGAVYLARHRVLSRLRETIEEFLDR
jgi:RNA polymerase sigma-70 factor, ECF subfamily